MKLFRKIKKPKISKKDLDKASKQLKEQKECPFCSDLIKQNKECMESHNVKNNLKSISWHQIKCKDCRARIQMMVECKKKKHK